MLEVQIRLTGVELTSLAVAVGGAIGGVVSGGVGVVTVLIVELGDMLPAPSLAIT
mgnify:CR=1 FL=1